MLKIVFEWLHINRLIEFTKQDDTLTGSQQTLSINYI